MMLSVHVSLAEVPLRSKTSSNDSATPIDNPFLARTPLNTASFTTLAIIAGEESNIHAQHLLHKPIQNRSLQYKFGEDSISNRGQLHSIFGRIKLRAILHFGAKVHQMERENGP